MSQQLISLGVDIIMCGDDVGTQQGMMISPQVWRKRLKPRLDQLFKTFRQSNPEIIIIYHSDGNIEPIIPDLIELGLDVLNPIQPKCMDPIEIKRKYGDRLAFFGTIDEQETLPFLDEEEVRREVKSRIQKVGYNGGLLLGATHNIQPDTPIKNITAMYDEVQSNPILF
jgi:uroporphyrinogen-III decarboxylase